MALFNNTRNRLSKCIEKDLLIEKNYIHLLKIMKNSDYSIPPIERVWLQLCRNYISETVRRINSYKKITNFSICYKSIISTKLYLQKPLYYRDFIKYLLSDYFDLDCKISINDAIHKLDFSFNNELKEDKVLMSITVQEYNDRLTILKYFIITISKRNIAIIGLALEIQRIRNGTYPESLDALVPEILDSIPVDPFTNDPYKYAKTGESITVSLPDSVTVLDEEQKKNSDWTINR